MLSQLDQAIGSQFGKRPFNLAKSRPMSSVLFPRLEHYLVDCFGTVLKSSRQIVKTVEHTTVAMSLTMGGGNRYPFSILLITSWLDQFQYGRSPYDITSQQTIPKLHTSEAEVNLRKAIASGAVQRTGIFPP